MNQQAPHPHGYIDPAGGQHQQQAPAPAQVADALDQPKAGHMQQTGQQSQPDAAGQDHGRAASVQQQSGAGDPSQQLPQVQNLEGNKALNEVPKSTVPTKQ